jgi:hypothetical protein
MKLERIFQMGGNAVIDWLPVRVFSPEKRIGGENIVGPDLYASPVKKTPRKEKGIGCAGKMRFRYFQVGRSRKSAAGLVFIRIFICPCLCKTSMSKKK